MRDINLAQGLLVLLLTFGVFCFRSAASSAVGTSQVVAHDDESHQKTKCFSSRWDPKSSEVVCALETETDKFLEWTWFVADDVKSGPDLDGATRLLLDGSMRLNMGKSVFELDHDELRSNLRQTHKAKIYFPFWPATDNESCEFSFLYRVNGRSSFVAGASDRETMEAKKYRWPKVSVVLIAPRNSWSKNHTNRAEVDDDNDERAQDLAEVRLLDTLEHPISYLANEFQTAVLIGKQMAGSWSLAFLVETKLDANLFELTDMKLTNCEPKGDEMDEFIRENSQSLMDLKSAFKESCNELDKQFQCRLSGRCISLDYRCDFGRDCGPNDDSDEFRCPADFEGRCDFEDSTLCQWVPMPRGDGKSWLWTETEVVNELEQANSTTDLLTPTGGHNKPQVDHTFQSRHSPGHYLLLGAHQLDNYRSAQLIGPRVQLKVDHQQCKFRFWAQTPDRLKGEQMKSAQFTVGFEHVSAMDLFGETQSKRGHSENNWRRFQVTLFDRRVMFHNVSIYALHLTFGNLLGDLELFALASGFVALDDFSFSPGCALSFYDEPPVRICGDTEFQCEFAPTQTPHQFCIPPNRVCDFKNDCGSNSEMSPSGWSSGAASDEAYCMHWFHVNRSMAFVGLEMSGVQPVNYEPLAHSESAAIKFTETVNGAFKFELPQLVFEAAERRPPKLTPFIITTQYETFESNLHTISGAAMRHVRESGLLLPRFHQAHANCRLLLTYEWAANSSNLLVSIYVIRSGVSTLYKRRSCAQDLSDRNGTIFKVSLGIGEQNSPFNVFLKISVDSKQHIFKLGGSNGQDSTQFSGSFSLTEYSFENCAHQSGLVNIAQAESVPIGDNDDDDYEEFEDELRYGSFEAESKAVHLRYKCPEDKFQCNRPILCLDQRLECDMQRDCQESGADELDCAAKGFVQFDFEPTNSYKQFEGWQPELRMVERADEESAAISWSVMRVDHELRARHDLGPPVDHSLGRASGSFLSFQYRESPLGGGPSSEDGGTRGANETRSESASAHTPRFEVSNSCKRLVLYVYDQRATSDGDKSIAYRFSVNYYEPSNWFEEALFATTKPVGRPDGWTRLEFELPHVQAADCPACRRAREFSVGFHGTLLVDPTRATPILAIDDLSLGPECKLVTGLHHEPLAELQTVEIKPEPLTVGQRWWWLIVEILVVSCSLLVFIVFLIKMRLIRAGNYQRHRQSDNLALDDLEHD